jgi:hypothetical protein
MTLEVVSTLRVALLVAIIAQLLAATVLFPILWRRFMEPLIRLAESRGQPMPALLRAQAFWRTAAVFVAVAPIVLWFVLGTPEGVAFLQEAFRRE